MPPNLEESFVTDAINESEDYNDPMMMEENVVCDGEGEENGETGLPNNDFCFTEADFLETQYQMNDATRHQGTYNDAWDVIKKLEGKVIETSSNKMGKMKWTVVASDSVVEDNFFWLKKRS